MKRLTDKVIVLTGGTGLLGRAICKQLTAEGAIVINADITKEESTEFQSLHCDITSEQSVNDAIGKVIADYGRIDGLVNNAYPRTDDWGMKFEKIPFASWQKNVDYQLNSYFLICQHVLERMRIRKGGSVVNMASIYGLVGPDFSVYEGTEMTMPAAYSAIKGGLINMSRYLASYYGPFGLRINCVSPGGVFNNQAESFVKSYQDKVPLRRMALPDDIAPSVSFLLSDEASYITGHNLIVDGGWTAI